MAGGKMDEFMTFPGLALYEKGRAWFIKKLRDAGRNIVSGSG